MFYKRIFEKISTQTELYRTKKGLYNQADSIDLLNRLKQ